MTVIGGKHDTKSFEAAIKERWQVERGDIYHCNLHNTSFAPYVPEGDPRKGSAEPCWECYEEFLYKTVGGGAWQCQGCLKDEHKATQESVPFCSLPLCECVCAG